MSKKFKYTLLTIYFIIINQLCFAQAYKKYYHLINQAELATVHHDFKSCNLLYDSAFAQLSPHPSHLKDAFYNAAKLKDFKKCKNLLDKLVEKGTDVSHYIEIMEHSDEFKNSSYYSLFMKDFDKKLQRSYEKLNDSLINILKEMGIEDQMCRQIPHQQGASSYYQSVKETDMLNYKRLRDIVKEYGWVNYKKVGAKYTGIANIILLHSSRHFSINSENWLFFENILKEEIKKGHVLPITLAQWIDQHFFLIEKQVQRYGSVANSKGILLPLDDLEQVKKNRQNLSLEPLNDYLLKKNYTLK